MYNSCISVWKDYTMGTLHYTFEKSYDELMKKSDLRKT